MSLQSNHLLLQPCDRVRRGGRDLHGRGEPGRDLGLHHRRPQQRHHQGRGRDGQAATLKQVGWHIKGYNQHWGDPSEESPSGIGSMYRNCRLNLLNVRENTDNS